MSIINRDNYETFFLLYADNELTLLDRIKVNKFIEANPDLQEELVMLQQSILKPGDIVFDDKSSLLKNEILPGALQGKLLSHLDHELPATDRKEIDELINGNAEIKKEWDILQQTKLKADRSIVFADKFSLYREETGRVTAFTWRKLAVAAVLLGLGIWGAFIYFNGNNKVADTSIAKNANTNTIPAKVEVNSSALTAPQATSPGVAPSTENQTSNTHKELAATQTGIKKLPGEKISPAIKKAGLPKANGNETAMVADAKKSNNLPQPNLDNINNTPGNKIIVTNVKPLKQPNNITDPGNNVTIASTGTQEPSGSFAANASYTDNSEQNNNRILFINEEKIKKTKLGGIFRKVKRVLERNTNIKTGGSNNIKVANLEFAIQ